MGNRFIPPERYEEIRRHLRGTDGVITDILFQTGFRLDDVMHLRVWQLRGESLRVLERKTGHLREVLLPEGLREALAGYLAGKHPLRYAFPALRAGGRNKMHRTTYWRHFLDAVRLAGYKGSGYTPHSLRKCYAVRRLAELGSLGAVQADMGHTRPEVTMIYAFSDRI